MRIVPNTTIPIRRHASIALLAALLLILRAGVCFSHETEATRADVGLDDKTGQMVPGDIVFFDEYGKRINLGDKFDKPLIVAPVYFGCMHECPLLLTSLAEVLGKIDLLKPGTDYRVISLSFDEHDTPAIAMEKKHNYLHAINRPFPEDAWNFLTGNERAIKRFTDAIGFSFQRDSEHAFSHPVTLVVIAPGGKIVRYIEGMSFLPFEVTMALTEASQGKVSSPARKALLYCFSYDPLKKSYVFNILKVTGTVMILFVGGFLVYLLRSGKKRGAA
jgi:protein SCO1/2